MQKTPQSRFFESGLALAGLFLAFKTLMAPLLPAELNTAMSAGFLSLLIGMAALMLGKNRDEDEAQTKPVRVRVFNRRRPRR